MIELNHVAKNFFIQKKEPGLAASIRSLVWRETKEMAALKDINLRVQQGEMIGLLGANGAGKTTLVKICTGIIRASKGTVRVLNEDPWLRSLNFRQNISLIMGQKAQLWWDLPAADCFLLLKEIYRIPSELYSKRLAELSAILGIEKQLNTQIRRLSLGERMKMELVAALLHQPRMIFLDEPTIGLDFNAQVALRDFIREYHRNDQPTIVLTSHYWEDIEALCKRIVVLREGAVVYDGQLSDLIAKYGAQKSLRLNLDLKRTAVHGQSVEQILAPLQAKNLVEIIRAEQSELLLSINRDEVSQITSMLLTQLPVVDFSVTDADVANIVAKIQSEGFNPRA